VVPPVDQGDVHGHVAEPADCHEAAEPGADDDDPVTFRGRSHG
jgi:hypothetical protein